MIGYKYNSAKGCRWRTNQGAIFPLSPPGSYSSLKLADLKEVLKLQRGLLIRWESQFDEVENSSWWQVINDSGCEIEDLSSKTRAKVRKGERNHIAKIVDAETVSKSCYPVYLSSFSRYDTHEKVMSEDGFKRAILCLPKETEFWIVYDRESSQPVAFSENYIEDGICSYITTWYTPESLKKYSAYFLAQKMTKYYLDKQEIRYVTNGTRNISHDTNIHEMLERRFKFRKAFSVLNVEYVGWLSFAVNVLYPFRKFIKKVPISYADKASIILEQEYIARKGKEIQSRL